MLRGTGLRRVSPYPPKAFCARNSSVKETRLELTFSRVDVYEDEIREVYRLKGPAGLRRGGERIRKTALAPFKSLVLFLCLVQSPTLV